MPTESTVTLELSWTAPDDDGGPPITDYEYRYSEGQSVEADATWESTGSTNTNHTLTGLDKNTWYTVEVRAVNFEGSGAASDTVTQRTDITGPTAPQNLTAVGQTATPNSDTVSIDLTWEYPADDGGGDITDYEYWVIEGTTFPISPTLFVSTGGTALTQEVAGLKKNTQYSAKVRAINSVAGSVDSNTVTLRTDGSVPNAPANLVVDAADDRTITVSYDTPTDDGGHAITDYEYELDGSGVWTSFGDTDNSNVISGLTPGTEYSIKVRAVNSEGGGLASDAVTRTTDSLSSVTLDVTITGTLEIEQGEQTTLTAEVTDPEGNTPAGTVTYLWSAPQGRFIGATNEATAVWEANFTDSDDVDVTITCSVGRMAVGAPTVASASLTALTDLGITGHLLNMYISETENTANGANTILYASGSSDSVLADGSDDDLSATLNIWRVQWHAGSNWFILNNDGTGDLSAFFSSNTDQSIYLVFSDGTFYEITQSEYDNGASAWARWATSDSDIATKLDNLGA